MGNALYDTNVMIEVLKTRKKLNVYITILNIVEFPRGLEFDLKVITPSLKDYLLAVRIS
ncbi:hypothetical protein [Thermococcus sp. MV5]|uniref:hypothetical protein n=1 Tax=Thermococcus sp. MV5 TaxID=1638272 RepID=UPI001F0EE956|nr:hypothetical protein [Thermococcus sp. MV5]